MSLFAGINGVARDLVGSGDYQVTMGSFSGEAVPTVGTFIKLPFRPKLVIYGTGRRYYPTCFLLKGGSFELVGDQDGGTKLFVYKTDYLEENGFLVPFGDVEDLPYGTNYFVIG